MKKLSEVTFQDAVEIMKTGYDAFFLTGKWTLRDDSAPLDEPCKTLYAKSKAYDFTFFDNGIMIQLIDDNTISFDEVNFDVKFACYIKAWELGYHVPGMPEREDVKAYEV